MHGEVQYDVLDPEEAHRPRITHTAWPCQRLSWQIINNVSWPMVQHLLHLPGDLISTTGDRLACLAASLVGCCVGCLGFK